MAQLRSQLTVAPGAVLTRLGKDEVVALCSQWESAYPADRRDIHVENYAWHVFSYNRYTSVRGDAALSETRGMMRRNIWFCRTIRIKD